MFVAADNASWDLESGEDASGEDASGEDASGEDASEACIEGVARRASGACAKVERVCENGACVRKQSEPGRKR